MMNMITAIALGGALGALTRYGTTLLITAFYGPGFQPLATLMVNAIGSGLMGLCYGLMGLGITLSDPQRGLIMVGFLGALTTFSSFALDAVSLFEKGQPLLASGYVAVSVMLSLASFVVVLTLVRGFAVGQ